MRQSRVESALQFERATKRFGKYTALDELNLSIEHGEIVGFLGPNGAGKTTAIHLAMGFLQLTSGSGTVLGRPFGDPRTRALVGYMPDNPAFFAGNARQTIAFAGRLSRMRSHELRKRTIEMLEAVGLTERDRDVRSFSRGMQQRVALAAALVHDPQLLILDEPTSALDPGGVIELREILRAARNDGKSIFFSSHQLSEVEELCDGVAFLRRGKLERAGTLDELTALSTQIEVIARVSARTKYYGKAISDNRSRFLVAKQDLQPCIESIWAQGGEVLSVTRVRRSLEELFAEEAPAE